MKSLIYFILGILISSCSDVYVLETQNLYDQASNLYRTQEYDKAKSKLDLLLSKEDKGNPDLVAKAYYLRGFIAYLDNESKNAYSDYLDALEIAKEIGDGKTESRLFNEIGQIFYERELYTQALQNFKAALSLADQATYQDKAYYHFGVGKTLLCLGEFDSAMEHLLDAVDINKKLRNDNSLAVDLLELGKLQSRAGNLDLAYKHYNEVVDLAPLTNNPNKYLWMAYTNLGNLAQKSDELDKAENFLTQALKYKGSENQLWITYNNLGKIYNSKGEYEKAWNCFKRSLAYNSEKGEMNELAITNTALKKTFEKLNQPDSLLHYTMLINDMALPMMQEKSWLKDEEEKIALLTKYQDYEREKAEKEQYAKTSWLMAFIMTFIFVSGVLSMRLWKIYNYKSAQKGHALIKNSNEMVYLLDMFKKEKEEMKKVMDQKIGA
ncbi:tetratricopeptide repeat protein [Reichenbachiella faecimaris]|uniref:tetratricopeptide repeat protein n=1 Tax=Reichenbachiella faecimaris TaxID=692418 RepID=UPI001593C5C4|nr:tetratricopeptide repeat protein [Reichenbachiella faecimaris]